MLVCPGPRLISQAFWTNMDLVYGLLYQVYTVGQT
jgi:hypothetical protein